MIQEFQGPKTSAAEKGFVRWRRDNPDGFVVNCGSRGWILHRTTCPNLKPDDETVCMTRNRKVCSEDRRELECWAENEGRTVSRCSNCLSFKIPWELIGVGVSVGSMLLKAWWSARRERRA